MIKVGTDMIANWALWNHVTSFLTTSTLESALEQRQDFSTVQSQFVYAKDIETARTRRSAKLDVCATPFGIDSHLSTTQQGNWLAERTRPELSCQMSLVDQCLPSPTVGQIRRANRWLRRARQFADLRWMFLGILPKDLCFVVHPDYPSKDQDETARTEGGYIIVATNPTTNAGALAPWSLETSSHVNLRQVKPWYWVLVWYSWSVHLHCCAVSCFLFCKQKHMHPVFLPPSVSSTASVCSTP